MSESKDAREHLRRALASKSVLVVCGSGGVGKTTTAAALGLQAALMGRRVLVCTIDPARRLATSLGLKGLREKPVALDLGKLKPAAGGRMSAMMLDVKSTFDELVLKFARDDEAKERILGNRFYQQLSSALAGSHEYMAMEKLLELSNDPRFDLVVLDTPPTRHALDFLEAPDRMMAFFDVSVLRWFLKPYFAAGRLTLRVATRTGAIALKLADRVLGMQFLQDVSEFFLSFESMYDGFKERAGRVYSLLRQRSSGFVLVASPSHLVLDEARWFHRKLAEKHMPFVGFVVNRMHPHPGEDDSWQRPGRRGWRATGGAAELDPELAAGMARVYREQQQLAVRERESVQDLEIETGEGVIAIPELESDVHDLRGLRTVGELLLRGVPEEDDRRPRRSDSEARR
jgi:anion-transporting  ArsA/GET3 family ATPase